MVSVNGRFAEPDFPHMLDLDMIQGNRNALTDLSSVLISETTAKNIFGDQNPMGKSIKINSALDVKVAGVYKDISTNSSFKEVRFIASWDLLKKRANYEKRLGWGNYWFQVYTQLEDGSKLDNVSALIKDVTNKNYKDRTRNYELFLFPMSKWRLYSICRITIENHFFKSSKVKQKYHNTLIILCEIRFGTFRPFADILSRNKIVIKNKSDSKLNETDNITGAKFSQY